MGGLRQASQDREPCPDAARRHGSQRSGGADAECPQRRFGTRAGRAAGAEASNDFNLKRSGVAGGEHCDRRVACLAGHSSFEGSECPGDCGVSAEQGGHVMRILEGKRAEAYVREIERRGSRLDKVEPAVRRIIDDVRKNGDRALRKYAREFDQLQTKQNFGVSASELRRAWERTSAELCR